MKIYHLLPFAAFVWVFACTRKSTVGLPEKISYNFHVRPILSDKCFTCHGPDEKKREANLRLDLPESALAPLKDRPSEFAIVPGKPENSEIFKRISSKDPDFQMPTPDSHLGQLSETEISEPEVL